MVAAQQQDVLEKSVAFLQKRDGIDKVLKVVRYAAKLACVSVLKDSDSDLAVQLRGFESSVGVTRCAALHVKKSGNQQYYAYCSKNPGERVYKYEGLSCRGCPLPDAGQRASSQHRNPPGCLQPQCPPDRA